MDVPRAHAGIKTIPRHTNIPRSSDAGPIFLRSTIPEARDVLRQENPSMRIESFDGMSVFAQRQPDGPWAVVVNTTKDGRCLLVARKERVHFDDTTIRQRFPDYFTP